jgi:hypothetical protein
MKKRSSILKLALALGTLALLSGCHWGWCGDVGWGHGWGHHGGGGWNHGGGWRGGGGWHGGGGRCR